MEVAVWNSRELDPGTQVCHESDEVSIAPDSYDARVRGLNATVQVRSHNRKPP